MSNQETGLFIVSYQIGNAQPGAVSFTLHLAVFTPEKKVTGAGRITQATNPPLSVATSLRGDFTYMTVMPDNTHVLVTATGYPPTDLPAGAGIGPVIAPNVELRMVLEQDWKSGVANYQYRDSEGNWHSVENAAVKVIPTVQATAKGN